jgi:hypothetical protein
MPEASTIASFFPIFTFANLRMIFLVGLCQTFLRSRLLALGSFRLGNARYSFDPVEFD